MRPTSTSWTRPGAGTWTAGTPRSRCWTSTGGSRWRSPRRPRRSSRATAAATRTPALRWHRCGARSTRPPRSTETPVRDTEQIVLPATDWSGMTPSRMWELIKDHDAEAATKQSAGWSLTWELLDHHHRRLEEYRDMLAARWRGPAADAFLARVDGLLASLSDTRRVALTNDPVLPHLSASLAEAKAKLELVKRQWEANQAKLAASAARPAVLRDRNPSLSPDPSKAQQAQLHAQAASIMTTLAQHTTEGYKALTMPTPYDPDKRSNDPGTPDPRPTAGGSAQSGGSSSVVASSGVAPRHDAPPMLAGASRSG